MSHIPRNSFVIRTISTQYHLSLLELPVRKERVGFVGHFDCVVVVEAPHCGLRVQ